MAKKFLDKVRVPTATTGQGTLTLGGAYDPSFFSMAEAMVAVSASDGDTTDYIISEGNDFEIVRDGVIGGTGTTITRGTTVRSKIANTTGTTKMTLSGAAQVRFFPTSQSLNQMLLDIATKLPLSGGTMTGPIVLAADAAAAMQAVTLQQMQSLAGNVGKRGRVRAATTANVTISTALNNADVLDGVTLATGDLVLVKNQSTAAQNGVYVVGVTPVRAAEFDTYNEHPGSLIAVAEGTANADTIWLCTSNDGGTLDTTAINFNAFTALDAAALGAVIAGATSKATPVDADVLPISDSAASGITKGLTWANLKATLKTYFDAIFSAITRPANAQTGTTYTFVAGDAKVPVTFSNAAAITATINTGVHAAGDQIDVLQIGAGKLSIAPGSGFTLNSVSNNRALSAQYAGATIYFTSSTSAVLVGSLQA